MNTLGKKVKAFRTAPERKWTAERMAQEVGTSRQNIQNLESRGFGHPRYIADLARVMRTTVDALLDRQSTGSSTIVEDKTARIAELVRALAVYFGHADEATREAAAGVLPRLALNPDGAEGVASLLERMLGAQDEPAKPEKEASAGSIAITSARKKERTDLGSRLVKTTSSAHKGRRGGEK
ncbi:MAG TPA: hypothetical protein VNU71_13350 [Burkholderiaceae bacterium]|nr:hypothetical protein [Burkholderiaceae bacterium]